MAATCRYEKHSAIASQRSALTIIVNSECKSEQMHLGMGKPSNSQLTEWPP